MKKTLILLAFALILMGCKSSLVNYALEKKGVYDEKIIPSSFSTKDKEIVFLPMHHIGRKEYYDDVKRKIDSLQNEDFVFFYEKVIDDATDSLDYYKFRKILHVGVPKNGYLGLLETLHKSNLKFKYVLINQPSPYDFGLTAENSHNVDMSIKMIINNVEKSQKITLEECDFLNTYTQDYKCKDKLLTSEEWKKYLIEDRDVFLANEIKNSKYPKIAIIYGKGHMEGFEKELLKY